MKEVKGDEMLVKVNITSGLPSQMESIQSTFLSYKTLNEEPLSIFYLFSVFTSC